MPDGSSVFLTGDIMRARYRNSRTVEELVTPGEVDLYRFDGFQFFARQVAKGSRLRLILNSPNSLWLQKNYNSGGRVNPRVGGGRADGDDHVSPRGRVSESAERAGEKRRPVS